MDETDEDVDFLPRRPPEDRRYEPRGVTGEGDIEGRFPEPFVNTLGRAGV